MRIVALALALLGLSSTIAPAGEPAIPPRPVLPDGLGVNIHFTDPRPGEMEMLAAGGIRWIRMDFAWGATEREKGQYDFAAYDRLLAAMEKHNIRAIWILDYSNPLYDDNLAPHTDEGRRAFAQWAAAAAAHFRGHGILWEMYNEPNIGFWKPKPDVKQYALLAIEVGKAIRQAAPEEAYIGPATSTMDFAFLEACFQAGLLDYWAGVSVHPYRQEPPETVVPDYARLRQMIDKHAPAGKTIPILSGEWGYSSAWANYHEAKQGKYLARQWLVNVACGVPISIWYDWHDDGTDPKEAEHHFGTTAHAYFDGRAPVYDPKPAYQAAKALTTALAGYQFAERLAVGESEDWVLRFRKGNQTRLVAWTMAASPRPVVVPTNPGRYRVTNHLGQPQPPLETDNSGLAITLTDAPQYVSPE